MTYAVLFPGQGSQSVGMCPDARAYSEGLFDEASALLGWNLETLIAEGPNEILTDTQHAQPALYVTSYALWTIFTQTAARFPVAYAGHSLGEYTAHAAAGTFSFAEGLALVAERGLAMADAAAESSSGMAALLGASEDVAEDVVARRAADGGNLFVANINAPGQIVVAGGIEDLEWLEANARDLGVRRAIRLNVAGGFHSPFMQSARERLDRALAKVVIDKPDAEVYANTTAEVAPDIKASLGEQLVMPVRFAATLENMKRDGVDTFVHVGPGDVTAGLAKRTLDGVEVLTVSTVDEARAVSESLSV